MQALAQRPLLWENLTWEEIASLRESGVGLCLLPVGATEQHGPHLGVGMDTCIAAKLCAAVSRNTGVPVLPAFPYGCSLGHSRRWPGTIGLQPQVLIDAVTQIFDWLQSAGFMRLLMVNGHVGNAAPLRCALEIIRSRWDGAMVGICNVSQISPRVTAEFTADAADWHAHAAETSLMMAQAPELIPRLRLDALQERRLKGGIARTGKLEIQPHAQAQLIAKVE